MRQVLTLAIVISIAPLATADLSLIQIAPNQAAVVLDPAEIIDFYITLEQSGTYVIELTDNAGALSSIGAVEEYGDGFDWRFSTIAGSVPEPTVAGQQVVIRLIGGGPMEIQLYDSSGTTAVGTPVNLPFFDGPATIEASSSSLSFVSETEGVNPPDQVFNIRNSGTGTLNWQVIESCDWLTISPESGSSTGEDDPLTISVDANSLVFDNAYECSLQIVDPNADNNPLIVPIIFTYGEVQCVKETAGFYASWVNYGSPDCWCYPKHCRGDADGLPQSSKAGSWAVGTDDLNIFLPTFQIHEPPGGPGIASIPNGICADFDHMAQGSKCGTWRVGTNDLNLLIANWQVWDPQVSDCPMDWETEYTSDSHPDGIDDYNFFITRYLSLNNTEYTVGESIPVAFYNMPGNQYDWIGLCQAGASEEPYAGAMLQWAYTDGTETGTAGITEGTVAFEGLPAGDYEIRLFFDGSYDIEDRVLFTVVE